MLLVELLHSPNPAVLLAAAEALLELAKVRWWWLLQWWLLQRLSRRVQVWEAAGGHQSGSSSVGAAGAGLKRAGMVPFDEQSHWSVRADVPPW